MGLGVGRATAESKTVQPTKAKRGRKKLYKAAFSSPLLYSPDTVRLEPLAAAREGRVQPGIGVRRAACVSGSCRAGGGKGERSRDHQETAQVQDLQEVAARR